MRYFATYITCARHLFILSDCECIQSVLCQVTHLQMRHLIDCNVNIFRTFGVNSIILNENIFHAWYCAHAQPISFRIPSNRPTWFAC